MEKEIKQALMTVFTQVGSNAPENIIDLMVEDCLTRKSDSEASQKCDQFVMSIIPRQLTDFDEIQKTAFLNDGYSDYYERKAIVKAKLFAVPTTTEPEELVLYYKGENQSIPTQGFHEYFKTKGYEVIDNPAPSLLIDACEVLTEEKLTELGIPTDVPIVLPSSYDNTFSRDFGFQCFLIVSRRGGRRGLYMKDVDSNQHKRYVFLLRKLRKKVS